MKDRATKIVVMKESLKESIIADAITFAFLVCSFAISEFYIGSTFLNGVLLLMMVFFAYNSAKGKTQHEFYSKEDAIQHIEENI